MNLPLKQLRKARSITQLELSKALKVSPSAVGMWEQGRNEPSYEMLKRIADYFNVSTDYLLGRDVVSRSLSKTQTNLLEGFGTLNNEGQNLVMGVLGLLKESHTKKKENSKIVQANIGNGNVLTVGNGNSYSLTN